MLYSARLLFMLGLISATVARTEPQPYVVGALGDSITAGFNMYRMGDNRDMSWATGIESRGMVESHARKLQDQLGRPVVVYNESFVGAQSTDLRRETDRLLRHKPDYVTLFMGANDICNVKDYDDFGGFEERMVESIDRLIAANPNVKILMTSLPNMLRLYDLGMANECQVKWDALKTCQPLLSPSSTPADRLRFHEIARNMNQVIQTIASRYPNNVKFRSEVGDYLFPWEFVSKIDCFHPSVNGHNKIAEITFDPTWH